MNPIVEARDTIWITVALAVALGVAAAVVAFVRPDPRPPLPALKELPEFELTERRGRDLTLEGHQGRVWIADFIFTNCAGPAR